MTSSTSDDRVAAGRVFLEQASRILGTAVEDRRESAAVFFECATAILERHADDLLDEARRTLRTYDGLPLRVNPFAIADRMEDERTHSAILAWALNSEATHGLGDFLIRRLLARHAHAHARQLARSEQPLRVLVTTELALPRGYVDVVCVVPGAVASIEVKVNDVEHGLEWESVRGLQTYVYRRQLEDPDARKQALQSWTEEAYALAGPNPAVFGFFLRRAGAGAAGDSATTSLTWLDIERDLHVAMQRLDVPSDARATLQAFRSTLLERSGSAPPLMPRVFKMRQQVDLAELGKVAPIDVLRELGAVGSRSKES